MRLAAIGSVSSPPLFNPVLRKSWYDSRNSFNAASIASSDEVSAFFCSATVSSRTDSFAELYFPEFTGLADKDSSLHKASMVLIASFNNTRLSLPSFLKDIRNTGAISFGRVEGMSRVNPFPSCVKPTSPYPNSSTFSTSP